MIDFLICYEHINREVENDTLVKYELEKRGYSCDIIPYNGFGYHKYTKRKNRAKVVVTPWLRYDENVYHYMQLSDDNNKLVDLQWEQVYSKANIDSGLCAITGESKKASHICWGENSKKRLMNFGVDEALLPITGAIQTDYGRELFKNYYFSKKEIAEKYNLDINKPWILFVSSFAYVNYDKKGIENLVDRFGQHIYDLISLNEKSFEICIEWFLKFVRSYDCEFIYRPHPSENGCKSLREMEMQNNNFHIIKDFSVKQWVSVCNKINIWISTSNAEIVSMNMDYFTLRPVDIPEKLSVESMKNEKTIDTYDDFYHSNTHDIDQSNVSQKKQMLSVFYDYDTNKSSYVKVADYLEFILDQNKKTSYCFSFRKELMYFCNCTKNKICSLILEKQAKNQNKILIDKLPLKKVIKSNLKESLRTYILGKATEQRMLDYLMQNDK